MMTGTISHWKNELNSGRISSVELVKELAARMESRNPEINALISWDTEAALKAAANADLSLPLGGIPLVLKDNINVLGEPTRCASKMLHNFISPYDATTTTRLKAAGAIPFGRANMDEFAMGSHGENSAFGATLNPANIAHVPGGSSSGSAAAVASHMAIAALGSDTGGSIRQPASHCGVVGLKPTYGRVSRFGLVAFASSLDQIGPITQNVEDSALILNAICGHDPKDTTSSKHSCEDFSAQIGKPLAGLRVGMPKEYSTVGNDAAVEASIARSVKVLEEQGAEIIEISLPHAQAVVATYYIIACAEASSNLSRFDGIRYGHRVDKVKDLNDLYSRSRETGFGAEVKRRIILGTYVLSAGFYDAYYARAQKVRSLVARDFAEAFAKVDVILGPVAPTAAPKLFDSSLSPLQTYLADIYTIPANLAGLPAISIPCPQEGALPIGVQLQGNHFSEARLISVAAALEKAWA